MSGEAPDGATTFDASGLMLDVRTRAELNTAEAENILKALGKHARKKAADAGWLDETFIRGLHRDMFDDVWEWAGKYRNENRNIGVPHHAVGEEIAKLIGDFRYWHELPAEKMPVIEKSVRLHHGLVRIHPFNDGNGRHARLTADLYLQSQDQAPPVWPDLQAAGDTRKRYVAALKLADKGDFSELIALIRELTPPRAA